MKKIFLVLIVSLLVVNLNAQNNLKNEYDEWKPSQDDYINFDISKYTTPDIILL